MRTLNRLSSETRMLLKRIKRKARIRLAKLKRQAERAPQQGGRGSTGAVPVPRWKFPEPGILPSMLKGPKKAAKSRKGKRTQVSKPKKRVSRTRR
jgi:hypothetical protein